MTSSKLLSILLILLVVLISGCASEPPAKSNNENIGVPNVSVEKNQSIHPPIELPKPTIKFLSPKEGQTFKENESIAIKVEVENLNLTEFVAVQAAESLRKNKKGEGHIQFSLGDWFTQTIKTEYVFQDADTQIVGPGSYQLTAQLVENDDQTQIGEPVTVNIIIEKTEKPVQKFVLEGDDSVIEPKNITVKKGDNIELTLKAREQGTYFGGLDFRSIYFDTGKISAGKEKTVNFTAEKSFTITSYWPASGVRKADAQVIVEE